MTITADEAAGMLRKGARIDATLDVAEKALAIAIPYLFRHVDPTAPDGRGSLSRFRKLCDNAGLPHDHQAFAGWLALRGMRVKTGDVVECRTGCPITTAMLSCLGTTGTGDDPVVLCLAPGEGVSIDALPPVDGEVGAVATPAGTVRFPNGRTTCPGGTLATALAAVERIAEENGRQPYDQDPDALIDLEWTRPERSGSIDCDSIHDEWRPEIATHADLMPHPSALIQSATLSTVRHPDITYRPRLPRRVIRSGMISNSQYEFVAAAGEAHSRHLPVDPEIMGERPMRVGFFIADGTGTGKTNENLGVVLDNRARGRRRAILVLEKTIHVNGFIDSWTRFGQNPSDFTCLWDIRPDDPVEAAQGILVLTYSMLRERSQAGEFVRVAQIAAWCGTDFDGPMLFDEAQCMRNAAGDENYSSRSSQISMQGLGGVALQDALPDARVVYASATGATDVHNLGYCTRLGLWGEGTAFENRVDFIKTFENGGIADLEQLTLSLKASGVYMARLLSFEGVEVMNLPVTLTPDERRVFNEAADMWKTLRETYVHLANICGSPLGDVDRVQRMRDEGLKGKIPYSWLNGTYESSRKASISSLISSFKARGVIADAERRVEQGASFVIQLQHTNEAHLKRALERVERPDEISLNPDELVTFAQNLPVEMYEQVKIPNPDRKRIKNEPWIKVHQQKLDEAGQPMTNPIAVAIRDDMIEECRRLKLPLPALDQIIMHFGAANVAEITGRTRRLVPTNENGRRDGSTGVVLEKRVERDRLDDLDAFHRAEKVGLVFSLDAGGSSLGYHAKIGTKGGEKQHYHYLIELGYRADQVTQGIGRTHRSDQTMPPVIALVTIDLPADKLFASRIVSNLFKLGALTQGHRQATSNGMFDERDCLEGPYAEGAWEDLQKSIIAGDIPGYTWDRFMQDMDLRSDGTISKMVWGQERSEFMLTNVDRMVNRVAALGERRQNLIFDNLRVLIDKRIEDAIADGTFKAGPEVLRAKSITILADRALRTDRIHGGSTRVLRIRRVSETVRVPFPDAYRRFMKDRSRNRGTWFAKHRTSGKFALIAHAKPMENALGERVAMSEVITPTGSSVRPAWSVDREPWIPFSSMDDRLEGMWNAAVEAAPMDQVSYMTIVADALLPVWPVLSKSSEGRDAVYRLSTDDGRQIVGRPIPTRNYPAFCQGVGEDSRPVKQEVDEVLSVLESGGTVAIASSSKTPHHLVGDFTGSRMTGVSIIIGNGYARDLAVVLDMLPGADEERERRPGRRCAAAFRPSDVRFAIESILSVCPAIYVEDSKTSNAVGAATQTSNAAGQAIAAAA